MPPVNPPFSTSRPLRILIGTMENGENLSNLAKGLRQLGHSVTTVFQSNESQHGRALAPDHLISDVIAGTTYGIIDGNNNYLHWNPSAQIIRLIDEHDLFVFQSGKTLLPGNDDLAMIKKAGKRIVSIFTGTDIRHWSAAEPLYNSWGRHYWPAHTEKWDKAFPNKREMVLDPYFYNNWSVANKLYTLRMAELYSDAILSVPEQSCLAVRPYFHLHVPIDIDRITPASPGREIPLIVHAPSHRLRKGSDFIQYTINLLGFHGVRCEYRQFEGMDNASVLKALTEADIAIDQVFCMVQGAFALEAMGAGCAVLASNCPEMMPGPEERPIFDIHPGNMVEQLRRVIEDRELRCRIAAEGRRYVERYHTPEASARSLLQSLERAENEDYDYWPSLFLLHYRLPRDTVLPPFIKQLNLDVIQHGRVPPGTDMTLLGQRRLIPDAAYAPIGRERFFPRTDVACGPRGYHPNPVDFD